MHFCWGQTDKFFTTCSNLSCNPTSPFPWWDSPWILRSGWV